ncbi:hypothetical protein SDC9_211400 [bioreactor metagenome]|uniref:Uncharacterized protein n=1 Tax=bioreactor metagenome TaxID=1076179 RepID=A0A645JIX8_9ZZZZ
MNARAVCFVEWVSVEDRLPEPLSIVLVTTNSRLLHAAHCPSVGIDVAQYQPDSGFLTLQSIAARFSGDGESPVIDKKVMFWAKFPEAPWQLMPADIRRAYVVEGE